MSPGPATAIDDGDWLVDSGVAAALERLDPVMRDAVASREPVLAEMALRLVEAPGKRLRPALVLLAAATAGASADDPRLPRLAAGVELLHIGSLHHDDIMDRAEVRRGVVSAQREWGPGLAAVAGTYVTTRGVELFLPDGRIVNVVSNALLELCTGQLQEAQSSFRLDVAPREYIETASRKTASLFELPCRVGAMAAGGDEAIVQTMARYGRQLGVAFQLTDDALDLTSDSDTIGKPTGSDVRHGSYNLPIVLALRAGGEVAEELVRRLRKKDLDRSDLARIAELLDEGGASAAALQVAEAHRDHAIGALASLPPGPPRDSLARLAQHATSRTR